MTVSNNLKNVWSKHIQQGDPRTLEVDPDLELRLIYGTDQVGQPIFGSISKLKPGIPELSDVVEVARTRRSIDGHWVLLLTLKMDEFTEVFVQLCAHIVDRVARTNSEAQGLAAFMASVEEWRTLLQAPARELLSLDAVRGLFGELWLGFQVLAPECTVARIMTAWRGPFQSDQDFQFAGGPLIEVKTVHPGARYIQVSSENQLSRPLGAQLFLSIVVLEDAAADTPGVTTLPELLDRIDQLLKESGISRHELSKRLSELGFDRSDHRYAEMHFLPTSVRILEVAEFFPRIEPSMLPAGVSRTSYALDLAALSPFECALSDLGFTDEGVSE